MHRRNLIKGAILLFAAGKVSAQEGSEIKEDPSPLENELEKHPRCVICNMDRRKFHYARHLLHYSDGHVQGTCSVHCAAECMLRERRRGFKAIYAPDFAVNTDPKPLFEASSGAYLIGSDLRGVMTPVSKVAFASREAALQAKNTYGGELGSFSGAITASMAESANGLIRRYENDLERQRRKRSGAVTGG